MVWFKASPQSLTAALKLYEVPVKEESWVRALKLPVKVGVETKAPALGTMFWPKVTPSKVVVVVEKVSEPKVVVLNPEPKVVVAELNLEKSAAAIQPAVLDVAVVQPKVAVDPPMTMGLLETVIGPPPEREEVAVVPK